MSMYSLIEYSDNYSKTSESLWQLQKWVCKPTTTESVSFKLKAKIIGKISVDGDTKDVEIAVSLRY